jgi:hypothetical protein
MKQTDDQIDILQNLEFSIVTVWRAHPEMTDYAAGRAYEAAFQFYRAEMRGRIPKTPALTELDAVAFEALKKICDFRLGRGPSPFPVPAAVPTISTEQLIDCLRMLIKSVERHTRAEGRQGYLFFIDQFLP